MPRHARGHAKPTWTDTLAAWLSWRKAAGKHEPSGERTPAAVLIAEPARFNWPGADPEVWPAMLHSMNSEPVVLRPEVRA
jgi:hypothetical protein